MEKARVIVKEAAYDYNTLRPIIFGTMDSFCRDIIIANRRVVIKPNLLTPAAPDKAILTHPLIVRAVVEYVNQRGARPVVSDSNAMGSFDKVLNESGIKDELKGLDVEFREFKTSVFVDVGAPFNRIELAKDAIEADLIINLPKLKTHVQMLMTLGVKNLFGCVVGLKKPEWHFRTGANREMFAQLLVMIHNAVRPSITILDGILAMEGEGPGRSGKPKDVGVIMGSDNAIALDITVCRMLGLPPDSVFTNKAAREMGCVPEHIEVVGKLPLIKDFAIPGMVPIVFGPKLLHGMMRRHLVQRPFCNASICKMCGECWRYCPAHAIAHDKKRISFDYDKCIRCYCCIEVCPHGALHAEEPLAGKVIRKIRERSS